MKGAILTVVWVLAAWCGCTKSTGPTATSISGELTDAGCLASGDGDIAAVTAEHALGDAEPAWSRCLWEGGSVSACGVPCDATTVVVTPMR